MRSHLSPWAIMALCCLVTASCGGPADDDGSLQPSQPAAPTVDIGFSSDAASDSNNGENNSLIDESHTTDNNDGDTVAIDAGHDGETSAPDPREKPDITEGISEPDDIDSVEPDPVLCPPSCGDEVPPVDPLQYLGTYDGDWFVEIVDVAADPDSQTVFMCTGTRGMLPVDVSDLAQPSVYWVKGLFGGSTGPEMTLPRCQHVVVLSDVLDTQGQPMRVVAVTHHGDELGATPFLRTLLIPDKPATAPSVFTVTDLDEVLEPGVVYEGLAVANKHLFVAAHDGGLRVYEIGPEGKLSHVSTTLGFENAWNVLINGSWAYIADAAGGLKVVDISDVKQPQITTTVELPGIAKDLTVTEQTLVVSLGTAGIAILDVTNPAAPVLRSFVETYGSATSLASAEGIVHIANWNDLLSVDVRDADKPLVVASETGATTKDIPRFLAVDVVGNTVFGGEWTGLQTFSFIPGAVAPEVRFMAPVLDFGALTTKADTQALVVYNDGYLPLTIKPTNLPAWATVKPQSLVIPPTSVDVFEVTVGPTPTKLDTQISFVTTDPDEQEASIWISANLPGVGVGDMFPTATFQDFATGEPLLAKDLWQGKVTLLAYFATF